MTVKWLFIPVLVLGTLLSCTTSRTYVLDNGTEVTITKKGVYETSPPKTPQPDERVLDFRFVEATESITPREGTAFGLECVFTSSSAAEILRIKVVIKNPNQQNDDATDSVDSWNLRGAYSVPLQVASRFKDLSGLVPGTWSIQIWDRDANLKLVDEKFQVFAPAN